MLYYALKQWNYNDLSISPQTYIKKKEEMKGCLTFHSLSGFLDGHYFSN